MHMYIKVIAGSEEPLGSSLCARELHDTAAVGLSHAAANFSQKQVLGVFNSPMAL